MNYDPQFQGPSVLLKSTSTKFQVPVPMPKNTNTNLIKWAAESCTQQFSKLAAAEQALRMQHLVCLKDPARDCLDDYPSKWQVSVA